MCHATPQFSLNTNAGTDELPQHPDYGPFAFTPQQPRKEGAIEYSPAFRDAASRAITASHDFTEQEAGFAVRGSGAPARGVDGKPVIQWSHNPGVGHNLRLVSLPSDMAVFHTHPVNYNPKPSQEDVDDAKRTRKVVYVASPNGLWAVGQDGKPQQLFRSHSWFSDKNPE